MKVLVTVASKHGSNREIAEAIVGQLRTHSMEADFVPPEEVGNLDSYDAVIIGSAVYMGHWMKPARVFVQTHADDLRRLPVWLFSSGAIVSENIEERGEPATDMGELLEFTHAREHRLFGGRLDRAGLNMLERIAVKAAHAEDGDARDWDAVRSWADSIAAALSPSQDSGSVQVPGQGPSPAAKPDQEHWALLR
jgi:menaquinone-dependent protoporphyrinogen oxidase